MSEAFQEAMKEGKIQDASPKPKKKTEYEKALTPSDELSEKHQQELLKSGLSLETINELGVQSSLNNDAINFPVWDTRKKKIRGYRARYNNEVIKANKYPSKEGKTPKYRPSEGLGNVFFFPHIGDINWSEIAQDVNVPIFKTEGEKKAAKLTQEGYPTIGLFGVNNWCKKEIKEGFDKKGKIVAKVVPILIPCFDDITWKKRTVYIVYDSDKYKNLRVLVAEAELWKCLKDLRADVKIINLPFDKEAKGIDDFFVKHKELANERFKDLINKATPVPIGYINICLKEEITGDIPHYMAEYIRYDNRVINTNLGFHMYHEGYYKKIDNEEYLKKIAKELLEYAGIIPKSYFLNEPIKLLSAYSLINDKDFNPGNKHNIENGALTIDLNTGDVIFEKHSPHNYFSYKAEAQFIPNIDTSPAENFLKQIIPDKNQRIISLEAIGMSIFPDIRKVLEFTRFILEFGEGSNGKSIYTNFRRRVIGNEVCSSVSIDQIIGKENRFVASTMYKKKANFSTENESSYIKESAILKQISSGKPGDELMVEFKHRQAFPAIINPILHFAINKPPSLPASRTVALERRIAIINFPNKFSKNPKDGELSADNRLENSEFTKPIVDGLLILTLKAIKEMIQRGHPWQEGILSTLKEAILKGSHKDLFFEECVEVDPETEISSKELHGAYTEFCLGEGIAEEYQTQRGTSLHWCDEKYDKACKKPPALSKWVKQRYKKDVKDIYVYDENNKRVRGFKGLKLKKKNVENELFNCAIQNNSELSQIKPLNSCTDKTEHSLEKNLKPEFIKKVKEKNAAKSI